MRVIEARFKGTVPTIGILVILTFASSMGARAQWAPAGVPFRITEMGNIHKDTVADALYFCGESSLNNDFDMSDGAVPVYTNGQWDTLGVFGGRVQTMVRWNDTLIAGGPFSGWNGDPFVRRCAYWNGEEWIRYGQFDNSIYRFKVINGELYAIGGFNYVDGVSCKGVAKRENGQWVPVGTMVTTNSNVQDLVEWNGTLYATGVIRFTGGGPKDLVYLEGENWLPLGSGVLGSFGSPRALAVYNHELYVSGGIAIGAGNAGHGIMRWDGEQFHPVGTGFQGLDGTYQYVVGAAELEVHDGLLWASGSFSYAGNVPCPGIAYWDGAVWCGLPLGPEPEVNSIEFFHDTLFASCHAFLNGEDVFCAVRFTGEDYSEVCSLPTALEEVKQGGVQLRAYRSADGTVTIVGVPTGTYSLRIFDDLGRELQTRTVVSDGTSVRFALEALSIGYSYFRLEGLGTVRFLGP
jgi:hypothetical protein